MGIVNRFLSVDEIMDNSPRKSSSSFKLDLSDLFVGLSYRPTSSLIASRKILRTPGVTASTKFETEASDEMSHSLNMNGSRTNPIIPKKDSNILQSMVNAFGSFTNLLSKIPNYMSSINNTLSVTVMPNEGIISTEYILKNLTQSKEHLTTYIESPTNILKNIKKNTLRDELHMMELESIALQQANFVLNEKPVDVCGIRSATWMDSRRDTEFDKQHNNPPCLKSDLEIAIEESMKHITCMKYGNEIIDVLNSRDTSHDTDIVEASTCSEMIIDMSDTLDNLRNKGQEKMTEGVPKIDNHLLDINEIIPTESDECANMEIPRKKPLLPRTWRKCNMVARNRGKGRGKLQLRKSGVSQLKHRKERSKQNIYCDIRNDLDDWEEGQQNLAERLVNDPNIATSSTISHYPRHKKIIARDGITHSDYERVIQTNSPHHQPKSLHTRRKTVLNTLDQSPSDHVSMVCDFRSRLLSECSIDSEDSCFIIFQNESGAECPDYDYESSSSEESEDNENSTQSSRKVRFILEPTIHVMIRWDFAYRAARRGPWEEVARDRERFRGRINCVGKVLNPILSLEHREHIYQNRFDARDASCEINWIE